jgi:hypothetical protein
LSFGVTCRYPNTQLGRQSSPERKSNSQRYVFVYWFNFTSHISQLITQVFWPSSIFRLLLLVVVGVLIWVTHDTTPSIFLAPLLPVFSANQKQLAINVASQSKREFFFA